MIDVDLKKLVGLLKLSCVMTDQEVNKIIAEFMGFELHEDYIFKEYENGIVEDDLYTESLDALVPVWEKLQIDFNFMMQGSFVKNNFSIFKHGKAICAKQNKKTIQQAAAHATAKAIVELG